MRNGPKEWKCLVDRAGPVFTAARDPQLTHNPGVVPAMGADLVPYMAAWQTEFRTRWDGTYLPLPTMEHGLGTGIWKLPRVGTCRE